MTVDVTLGLEHNLAVTSAHDKMNDTRIVTRDIVRASKTLFAIFRLETNGQVACVPSFLLYQILTAWFAVRVFKMIDRENVVLASSYAEVGRIEISYWDYPGLVTLRNSKLT